MSGHGLLRGRFVRAGLLFVLRQGTIMEKGDKYVENEDDEAVYENISSSSNPQVTHRRRNKGILLKGWIREG